MDDYSKFSDAELMQAVELLVRPEWLRERAVMIAILAALDYTPACVQEQLDEGKPLHDGKLLKLT